jgi:hypothetical protein
VLRTGPEERLSKLVALFAEARARPSLQPSTRPRRAGPPHGPGGQALWKPRQGFLLESLTKPRECIGMGVRSEAFPMGGNADAKGAGER